MKNFLSFSLFLLLFPFNFISAQVPEEYSETELIFKLKNQVDFFFDNENGLFNLTSLDSLNEVYRVRNIVPLHRVENAKTYIIKFSQPQNIEHLISIYSKTGLFSYVEPNYIGRGGGKRMTLTTPNDTYFFRQWALFNDGSFSAIAVPGADIAMKNAWDIEQGSSSITVAILDSGAKLDHPEFAGRIWENPNETIDNVDNDNNGYIDDIHGWDFAYSDSNPTDDYGHGTNVTGIIGANGNNNIGYAGVDWHCKLMICKVLDINNSGQYFWIASGIYYAVDHGADVINMSLGGSSFSNALQDAVNYAHQNNVVIVACMMNENSSQVFYPAGYENVIAVGSTDSDDTRSDPFFWSSTSGSNYGSHIDVVAPGNYIYGLDYQSDTDYDGYWGGTSQATPHVAGLCSLLFAQDPTRTPDDIRQIIESTAEDQVGDPAEDTPGFDIYYGYGRINAYNALTYLSVPENQLQNVAVYPNPTTDYLIVENTGFTKAKIFNLNGELVLKKQISQNQTSTINTSFLNTGIYFLQLKNSGKTSTGMKIIISE